MQIAYFVMAKMGTLRLFKLPLLHVPVIIEFDLTEI